MTDLEKPFGLSTVVVDEHNNIPDIKFETTKESLQETEKILAGSYINTDSLVDSLTRDGFITTLAKATDSISETNSN